MAVSAIHHIDLAVRDIERSRAFYNLLLVMPRRNPEGHDVLGYGQHPDPVFWIRNGKPPVGKLHVAFLARTHEAVDAFHAAALVAGGTCNGPPGLRPRYGENYYAAFVIDPDGNNIEAVCRAPDGVDR